MRRRSVLIGANAKVPDADDVRHNHAQAWTKARTTTPLAH